jgi:broad-specificity NMP kinase
MSIITNCTTKRGWNKQKLKETAKTTYYNLQRYEIGEKFDETISIGFGTVLRQKEFSNSSTLKMIQKITAKLNLASIMGTLNV